MPKPLGSDPRRKAKTKAGARRLTDAARETAPRANVSEKPTTREAILSAALDEFATNGFAATRLDDVARRAGVAKGTIYVHFRDKDTLFEEIVRASLGPLAAALAEATLGELTLRDFLDRLADTFVREILQTRRKLVLRLILAEGGRFPQLAHAYYRDVIKRGLGGLRGVVQEAIDRGEIRQDALLRFPHLFVAPAIMAVIWDGLFARFEPLDAGAMMREHVGLLFAALQDQQR